MTPPSSLKTNPLLEDTLAQPLTLDQCSPPKSLCPTDNMSVDQHYDTSTTTNVVAMFTKLSDSDLTRPSRRNSDPKPLHLISMNKT